MITRGEALGHNLWIDGEFLQATADSINATGDQGVKARFTHPGLSSDGLGKYLGRAKNAVIDGDVVRADLHFSDVAATSPDGDLRSYVMQLAAEDPEAFGASIVFEHDFQAEEDFMLSNGGHWETDPYGYSFIAGFTSPDPLNTEHYPHARLARLRAADVVDEPAANPAGLFHRGQELPAEAEALMSFALGLSKSAPQEVLLGIHPDRVRGFVSKFLERHKLSLVPKEEGGMSTQTNVNANANEGDRSQFRTELNEYISMFGAQQGAQWFAEGKPKSECFAAQLKSLREELATQQESHTKALAAKDAEIKSLQDKLASLDRGETQPLSSSGGDKKGPKSLAEMISIKK